MDPMNAHLVAHFGMALANLAVAGGTDSDVARRTWAEADFQIRRALKLAPNNEEVQNVHAEVVKLLRPSSG